MAIGSAAFADVKVGQTQVKEEQGVAEGAYIPPNEHESQLYAPLLAGQKGALISVGTFRTLDRAAAGDFNQVFMLDYDEVTTRFNRLNLKLIAESKNRYEYIQKLTGLTATPAQLEAARSGAILDVEFFFQLTANYPLRTPATPTESEIRLLLNAQPKGMPTTIAQRLQEEIQKSFGNTERRQATIFGSDLVFQNVQARISRGEIIPLNGSLAGGQTLRTLARALRAQNSEVTVVDLSNAMNHVLIYNAWTPIAARKVVDNIRALPLADDALILFTAHARLAHIHDLADSWIYFAVRKGDFLNAAELGHLDMGSSYTRFMQRLYEYRVEQDIMHERLIVPGPSYKLTERASLAKNWCRTQMTRLLTQAVMRLL